MKPGPILMAQIQEMTFEQPLGRPGRGRLGGGRLGCCERRVQKETGLEEPGIWRVLCRLSLLV